VLSNSSSDVVNSRFYDGLSDVETKTLKKSSGHALHQHIVDVHINNSGHSSGTDELDCKTLESDKNVDYRVRKDSENINESIKEDNESPEVPHGLRDSSNVLTELKEDYSVKDQSIEDKNSQDKNVVIENCDDRKENIDPNKTFLDANKYESEIETEDESITIATMEPCINCLELAGSQLDRRTTVRCSHCIAKFNKQKMFGDYGNDQEVINFEGKLRERYALYLI
jgi:hypothetical protein